MGPSLRTFAALAVLSACRPASRPDGPASSSSSPAAGTSATATDPVTIPAPVRGRLALGVDFSCALDVRGGVWCWGGNDHGQLGDGSELPSARPVRVRGLPRVEAIVAGEQHACALAEDGGVWCWGSNHRGQLGDRTNLDRRVPVPVQGLAAATLLVANAAYTCASTADAFACWGDAPAFNRGWHSRRDGTAPQSPARIDGLGRVDLACAGDAQTCVRADGRLSCWGLVHPHRTPPDQFDGFGDALALACGREHVCGLRPDGTTACVGLLLEPGEFAPKWVERPRVFADAPKIRDLVGNGSIAAALDLGGAPWWWFRDPDPYSGLAQHPPERLGARDGAVALAVGAQHQCLLDRDGRVACRGHDDTGQLGSGASPLALAPERIDAARGLTGLSSGPYYTCGVRDGEAWCWGDLDLERFDDELVPTPASRGPGVAVYAGWDRLWIRGAAGTATSAGRTLAPARPLRHVDPGTGCGLRVDGVLECDKLRLDARSFDRGEAAGEPPRATDIVETISAPGIHCGRRRSGRVTCVKVASNTVLRSVDVVHDRPGREVAVTDAIQLVTGGGALVPADSPDRARGGAVGCAVRRTGEVVCWPMNDSFALRARPVAGLRDVVALTDGGWHTCARLRDGAVRCWGDNRCGQLGDGTVAARPLPGVAVALRDVDELSAGLCHTCARTRAGEVWCWGRHEARATPPRWRDEFTPVPGLPGG